MLDSPKRKKNRSSTIAAGLLDYFLIKKDDTSVFVTSRTVSLFRQSGYSAIAENLLLITRLLQSGAFTWLHSNGYIHLASTLNRIHSLGCIQLHWLGYCIRIKVSGWQDQKKVRHDRMHESVEHLVELVQLIDDLMEVGRNLGQNGLLLSVLDHAGLELP